MTDNPERTAIVAQEEFDAFGILNAAGDFWSHSVHKTESAARDYIRAFWGKQTDMAEKTLLSHTIVPIIVTITENRGDHLKDKP